MRQKVKMSITWSNGLTETREINIKTLVKAIKQINNQDPKFFNYV
jgi:hypothetical protein